MKTLESTLRSLRASGRTALVPYLMAGATPDWARHVEAAALGGADAIEIGIPFSDPMMDGVVIQEAGLRALGAGTTFESIGRELEALDVGVPLIAMTYYNIFLHHGLERSAGRLADFGITGAIVPDLSLEECEDWTSACGDADVATIFLVAPSTPASRIERVSAASEGFVYASARMAVTGSSTQGGEGQAVVERVRAQSDLPVYVGIGVGTPDQAAATAQVSDGVIVGSALVRIVLDGGGPQGVESFVRTFRDAVDNATTA
ncbi:MAG: tryptophan synthase subunit alpha [Acidimicrobiales bacterium]